MFWAPNPESILNPGTPALAKQVRLLPYVDYLAAALVPRFLPPIAALSRRLQNRKAKILLLKRCSRESEGFTGTYKDLSECVPDHKDLSVGAIWERGVGVSGLGI